MITHLEKDNSAPVMHISHLLQYISAYVPHKDDTKELGEMIELALCMAKDTSECQYVNMDGECELRCSPTGYVTLMLPWRTYRVYNIPEITIQFPVPDVPVPPPPQKEKYETFFAVSQGPFADGSTEVFVVDNKKYGPMMCIATEEGPIYITKQQAMDFFGLKEAV